MNKNRNKLRAWLSDVRPRLSVPHGAIFNAHISQRFKVIPDACTTNKRTNTAVKPSIS